MQVCRTYLRDLWQILLEKVQKLAERANWHNKVAYTFIKEMELGRGVWVGQCITTIYRKALYREHSWNSRSCTSWHEPKILHVLSSLSFAWRMENPNGLLFLKQCKTWSRFLGHNCCSYSMYLLSSHNNLLQSLIDWNIISCIIVMSC